MKALPKSTHFKFPITILLLVVTFCLSVTADALDFEISQITDSSNVSDGSSLLVNDLGTIVWLERNSRDIFMYDGSSITTIPNINNYPLWHSDHASINNLNEIAWGGTTYESYTSYTEVYLYNDGNISKLTDNYLFINYELQMNDTGTIVWTGAKQAMDSYDIYKRDSNGTINSFGTYSIYNGDNHENHDCSPKITNNNNLYWASVGGNNDGIYINDSNGIRRLTEDGYCGSMLDINLKGEAVWAGAETAENYVGDTYYIFMNDVNGVKVLASRVLPSDTGRITPLNLNNKGQVIWLEYVYASQEKLIFMYDNNEVKLIADVSTTKNILPEPSLNDNGEIAWCGAVGGNCEIFFYDGNDVSQVTNIESPYMVEVHLDNTGTISWIYDDNVYVAKAVPEPSSILLLISGLGALAFFSLRTKN